MTTENTLNGSAHTDLERDQGRINILVVGSDLDDVVGINRELRQADIAYRLHVVGDSAEAMTYLMQEQHYACAPRPDLILLNAGLPVISKEQLLTGMATCDGLADTSVLEYSDTHFMNGTCRDNDRVVNGHDLESRAHAWLVRKTAATGSVS